MIHQLGLGGTFFWARWDYLCTTWPMVFATGALSDRFCGPGRSSKIPPGPKRLLTWPKCKSHLAGICLPAAVTSLPPRRGALQSIEWHPGPSGTHSPGFRRFAPTSLPRLLRALFAVPGGLGERIVPPVIKHNPSPTRKAPAKQTLEAVSEGLPSRFFHISYNLLTT